MEVIKNDHLNKINKVQRLKASRKRQRIENNFEFPFSGDEVASNVEKKSRSSLNVSKTLQVSDNRKIASSVKEYLAPGGCMIFKPRLEWCSDYTSPQTSPGNESADDNETSLEELNIKQLTPHVSPHCHGLESTPNPMLSKNTTTNSKKKYKTNYSLTNSILFKAIMIKNSKAILDLLNHGAPVNHRGDHRTYKGVTPLLVSCRQGCLPIVEALLQKGADPHIQNTKSGTTPLIQASHFGHLAVVKCLLQYRAQVDQNNKKQTNALMHAAQEGHDDIVQTLIQHGANVNTQNLEQMTPLLLASQRGHAGVVKNLLRLGANPNQRTKLKASCLMLACKRGHMEVVKMLLSHDANAWCKDCKGRNAKVYLARYLVNETDHDGRNSNMEERWKHHDQIKNLLSIDMQLKLIEKEMRIQRNYIFTKMHVLLQSQRAEVVILNKPDTFTRIKSEEVFDKITPANIGSTIKSPSVQATLLTMTMPALIMEHIVAFIPYPPLYINRLSCLKRKVDLPRIQADNEIITHAFDLIEDLLEECRFLEQRDSLNILLSFGFSSWVRNKVSKEIIFDNIQSTLKSKQDDVDHMNVTQPMSCLHIPQNTKGMRKNYPLMCIFSEGSASPTLREALLAPPYLMRQSLFDKLKKYGDVVKLIRSLSHECYFDVSLSKEVVDVAEQTLLWRNKLKNDGIIC